MKISVGSELRLQASSSATVILNIEAARTEQQIVFNETLQVSPETPIESYELPRSGIRYSRLRVPAGEIIVRYSAQVSTSPVVVDPESVYGVGVADLPFPVLPYTFPSRYCQSDRLGRFAQAEFSKYPPGHGRVTAICNWIHDHVEYVVGSSDAHTSVHETLVTRAGVCRDFAHLGIALCRALGIPARFVSCYAAELHPPDFHAVVEAYLGGRWFLFDATRQAALHGLVRIGLGRDAADASITTMFGQVQSLKPKVQAHSESTESWHALDTQAVSLSTV